MWESTVEKRLNKHFAWDRCCGGNRSPLTPTSVPQTLDPRVQGWGFQNPAVHDWPHTSSPSSSFNSLSFCPQLEIQFFKFPLFRALSGRLKFTVQHRKFNKDSLSARLRRCKTKRREEAEECSSGKEARRASLSFFFFFFFVYSLITPLRLPSVHLLLPVYLHFRIFLAFLFLPLKFLGNWGEEKQRNFGGRKRKAKLNLMTWTRKVTSNPKGNLGGRKRKATWNLKKCPGRTDLAGLDAHHEGITLNPQRRILNLKPLTRNPNP